MQLPQTNHLDPIAGAREVVIGVAVGGLVVDLGLEGMRRVTNRIRINMHETSDIKVDKGTIIVNGGMIRRWLEVGWVCRSDRIGIQTCMMMYT